MIVAIVEDEPLIAGRLERFIREILEKKLTKVVVRTSLPDAMHYLLEQPVDLLLLDLMMPGVSGWDVYREMKADDQLAEVPVIVITAKVPEHGLEIAEGLPPVDDYITKPFAPERLARSVQNLLPR